MDEHQVFAVQVLHGEAALGGQPVVDRHGAADRLARKLEPRALAQVQHGLVENAGHHVDVLPEVRQNLPSVFRRILKRHELELHVRAVRLQPWPQVHEHLRRRHRRGADADDVRALAHGVSGARHGIPAVLDDVFRILIQGFPGLGQHEAAVRAGEKLHLQTFLEQVDLLDDGRRGNIQPLRRLVEAAGVRHAQKGIELRVVHRCHRPFLRSLRPGKRITFRTFYPLLYPALCRRVKTQNVNGRAHRLRHRPTALPSITTRLISSPMSTIGGNAGFSGCSTSRSG